MLVAIRKVRVISGQTVPLALDKHGLLWMHPPTLDNPSLALLRVVMLVVFVPYMQIETNVAKHRQHTIQLCVCM
jgi:hypothetical protein